MNIFNQQIIARLLFCFGVFMITPSLGSATQPPSQKEHKEMQRIFSLKGHLTSEQAAIKADYKRRIESAKAFGNYRINPYLFTQALRKLAKNNDQLNNFNSAVPGHVLINEGTAPTKLLSGMPSVGNVKIFALLIDFSDHPAINENSFIHERLFGEGDKDQFPTDSLASYYKRASYGKLDLSSGTTLGWYRPSVPRSGISQTREGRESLIEEAIQHFDDEGLDFSQYDNDGDGKIDYFMVFYTGSPDQFGGFWWGYQTLFSNSSFKVDGKSLNIFSWQWANINTSSNFFPNVVIHETGHALGLPDFYDYDEGLYSSNNDVGPRGGVGGHDVMGRGSSSDHNCFSKWVLGWLTPTLITSGSQSISLQPSEISQDCVVVWPGLAVGSPFSELFVIQNRQSIGNDQLNLNGQGILAWHVDATLNEQGSYFKFDNSFTDHKLLRVMEADGLEEIEQNILGNKRDYYNPGDMLDNLSSPNTKKYSGQASGVFLRSISANDRVMSAVVGIDQTDPLQVLSPIPFNSTKEPGKQAIPQSMEYSFKNSGSEIITWSVATNVNWLDISETSGQLLGGEQKTITVTINSAAEGLSDGDYSGTLTISNDAMGDDGYLLPLRLSIGPAPANDLFQNAFSLNASNFVSANNKFANEENGEPKHGGVENGGKSVWWKWKPNVSGQVLFLTQNRGTEFDTLLSVYGGQSFERMTTIAANDDALGGIGSQVQFTAQAGMEYFIAVDGWRKLNGKVELLKIQSTDLPPVVASILPSARSGQIGQPLSAFASIINTGAIEVQNCGIFLDSAKGGLEYQTTNLANQLVGSKNTPVNIGAGETQSFVFVFTPSEAVSEEQLGLVFSCENIIPAASVPGLNRLMVSASMFEVPDLITIAATATHDGIVNIPGETGTGIFAASTINIGAAGSFTAYVDDAELGLAIRPLICKTDAASQCDAPPAASVNFNLQKNEIALFAAFIQGQGNVLFDPANNRLFLRLEENGVVRGATSVAVRTQTN